MSYGDGIAFDKIPGDVEEEHLGRGELYSGGNNW